MTPPIKTNISDSQHEPTGREIMSEISHLRREIGVIGDHITGNGDPSRGLIVKVDRLEQSHESRKWLAQTAVGAAFTSIIASAWSLLHKS